MKISSMPSLDLDILEVGPDGLPYVLYIYEVGKNRPTTSLKGENVESLRVIVARVVSDGGIWIDLTFYPMHTLDKFVIESTERVVDEW